MNKKLLAFTAVSALIVGGLSFAVLSSKANLGRTKEVKALNEDLHVDPEQFWTDVAGGTAKYSINTSADGHFYDSSDAISALYDFTIVKVTHTPGVRQYNASTGLYYINLPYCETAKFESPGPSYMKLRKLGDYQIKSISFDIRSDEYGNLAHIAPTSTWDASKNIDLEWDNGKATYVFDDPVDDLFVYAKEADGTKETCQIKGLSINVVKGTELAFDTQGGHAVTSQYLVEGEHPVRPTNPVKDPDGGTTYTFIDWFTAPDGGEVVDFDALTIDAPTTVYAHWEEHVLSTFTITFDSQGGSAVDSQTIPDDGETKFSKPVNPTKPSDDKYSYTFYNWYLEPECYHKYQFDTVPTGDLIVYAGYKMSAVQPAGTVKIDPKTNVTTWGVDYAENFQGADLLSRETFDTAGNFPAMRWLIEGSEISTNVGLHTTIAGDHQVIINQTTMTMSIIDPSKYFSQLRMEFSVVAYNESEAKTITLSTGGVESDSGLSPFSSTTNELVLDGVCTDKPQEFTITVGRIAEQGVRVRYIYAEFGTYSDSEMAEHYAANFNAANVCGVNPEDGLNEAKWLEQKEAYEALPTTVQEFLRDSEATSGEMGEMLERYDRVVFLHGVEYDFMGRVDAGKLVLTNTNPIVSISNNSSIIIVAVVSLISLTAIGGFFFYRRRKEN